MLDRIDQARNPGAHYRKLHGAGFQGDLREALAQGRQHTDIAGGIHRGHIGDAAVRHVNTRMASEQHQGGGGNGVGGVGRAAGQQMQTGKFAGQYLPGAGQRLDSLALAILPT